MMTTFIPMHVAQKQIDYIYGTEEIGNYFQAAGALPFGTGYSSNHRALFVMLNLEKKFQQKLHQLTRSRHGK
jgi:hypothetical protein